MKRIVALLLALTICLFSAAALAEGKLTVTEKNLIEFADSDTAYFFAKVENTGDAAIGVGAGKLVGFSSDDDVLVSESYVTANPSSVILQPGESLYVSDSIWESALETADIADFKFSMDTEDYVSEVTFCALRGHLGDEGRIRQLCVRYPDQQHRRYSVWPLCHRGAARSGGRYLRTTFGASTLTAWAFIPAAP